MDVDVSGETSVSFFEVDWLEEKFSRWYTNIPRIVVTEIWGVGGGQGTEVPLDLAGTTIKITSFQGANIFLSHC